MDYTCRLVADVIKTSYARHANRSKHYFGLVWSIALFGTLSVLVIFQQYRDVTG